MSLHEKIKEEVTASMKARDAIRLSVLRGMVAAFTNELVAKRRKPDETLSDEDALPVISREAKKRRESIEQFRAGGRNDLADKEAAELNIIKTYLPEMLSPNEIRKIVLKKKEEMGITDQSKKGILMGAVMKELWGKAEGGLVKSVVDSLF